MSDIDPLAGCSPLCLAGIVLYGLWFWIPVALLAATLIGLAVSGKLRRPWQTICACPGGGLALLLAIGLIGYVTPD